MKCNQTSALKSLLVTVLLGSTLAALAQPKPQDPPRRPPGDRERFQGQGMRPGGANLERFFSILTEEQRESMRNASEGQREKLRDLEEKSRDARKAVIEASLAEKFDEDVIRKKVMDAAKVEADLTVLRAKALSQVKPPLSKEQIEKIKNPQLPEGAPGRGRFGDGERPKPIEPGRDKNDLPPPPKPQ